MGLTIVASHHPYDEEGFEFKEELGSFSIGYMGFGALRMEIARAFNPRFGEVYTRMHKEMFGFTLSDEEKTLINALSKQDAAMIRFLYHPDCEGELDVEEVAEIHDALSKLDTSSMERVEQFEELKTLFGLKAPLYFT